MFPPEEASLIAGLVAKDAPFYDANISQEAVKGLNTFSAANGSFTLQWGSRAIDAGLDIGLPYLGLGPDLGAFEMR